MRAISSASTWSVLAPVRPPRRAAAVVCGGTSATGTPCLDERLSSGPAVVARSLDPDLLNAGCARPGDQLGVPG